MPVLHTTLGPRTADELGLILPHEHVFVDLRTPDSPAMPKPRRTRSCRVMAPQIAEAPRPPG